MKHLKKILIVILIFVACNMSHAQDIHFSQFYTQNWLINPAKVGFFNGNYRLSAVYRSQWNSVTNAFQTIAASGEMSWVIKGTNRNILGMEFHAFSDKAGDAGYTTNDLGYNIAYTFCLDRFHSQFLGFGSGISYVNNYFDISKLRFDNEYYGISNREKFNSTAVNYADLSEGVEYNYIPSKDFSLNLGAAVYHINSPTLSYTADYDSKLYRSYIFNGGGSYSFNSRYSIFPKALVDIQGPHKEINTGTFLGVQLNKEKEEKYKVYFGAWYRWGDAFIPVMRFDLGDLSMGLSYDINVSKLYIASEGRGGPEFTVTYNGLLPHTLNKKVMCPRF